MKSKAKGMVRHRISARVLPAFYNKFSAAMKVLGLSQQDLIVQALETEFGRVDVRKQCQVLLNANAALTEKKEKLLKERNEFREALKVSREKLRRVQDTAVALCAADCGDRASVGNDVRDKLSALSKCDRDAIQSEA